MRFGQTTMKFFGQTNISSPFGKKGANPIGLKVGVKSQSGATAEDLRDHMSVSEMSCTSGDSTQVCIVLTYVRIYRFIFVRIFS